MAEPNMPNLILTLKVAGEARHEVRAVARIQIDGQGRLLYWDTDTGRVGVVEVAALESFAIHPLTELSKVA